jgi:hypothetical protein
VSAKKWLPANNAPPKRDDMVCTLCTLRSLGFSRDLRANWASIRPVWRAVTSTGWKGIIRADAITKALGLSFSDRRAEDRHCSHKAQGEGINQRTQMNTIVVGFPKMHTSLLFKSLYILYSSSFWFKYVATSPPFKSTY